MEQNSSQQINKKAWKNPITELVLIAVVVVLASYFFQFDISADQLQSKISSRLESIEKTPATDLVLNAQNSAGLSTSYQFTYSVNGEKKTGVIVFVKNILMDMYKVQDIKTYTTQEFDKLCESGAQGYSLAVDDYYQQYTVYVTMTGTGYTLSATTPNTVLWSYLLIYIGVPAIAAVVGWIRTKKELERRKATSAS